MTPNTLARVGLFLLGVYLIVSACAAAASAAAQPIILGSGSPSINLTEFGADLILGIASVVVLGVLPGSFLIANSEAWAAAWFPPSDSLASSTVTASSLYSLGLLLMGIYLTITGITALLGGALASFTLTSSEGGAGAVIATHHFWYGLGTGVGQLLGGAALWFVGRRATLRAA